LIEWINEMIEKVKENDIEKDVKRDEDMIVCKNE
jgi:hypothetical protein